MTAAIVDSFHAKDRAAFGARFFDGNQSGWADVIDLDAMNMSDGMLCVGAQIAQHRAGMTYNFHTRRYINFWNFKDYITRLLDNSEITDAFMHAGGWWADDEGSDIDIEYAALTEAWKQEVLARR